MSHIITHNSAPRTQQTPLFSGPLPSRELFCSLTGEDVRQLQRMLNHALHPSPGLVEDGIFGYQTELAVIRFQSGHQLVADGIAGPKTMTALRQAAGGGSAHNAQGLAYSGGGSGTGQGKAPVQVIHEGNVAREVQLVRRAGKTVPHFWQGDPRWGGCAVGTGRNMACIGCGVTSIAMVLAYFGKNIDPGSLNQWLMRNGGYVGCSVNWHIAFQAHPHEGVRLTMNNPMYTTTRDFRRILYQRIAKNIPTLVDVDYGRDRDTIGNHYVVVSGCTESGRLIMNDPATPGGNGARQWNDRQNLIETTTRGGGYRIVSLCLVNPA